MERKMLKIATYIFYLLSLVTIAYGGLYFFRSDIMPYHYAFLHTNAAELNKFNPNIIKLMLAFIKIIGSSFIGIGFGIAIANHNGIRREKKWAWWSILFIYSLAIIITYYITLMVSSNITEGSKPPSYLALGMIILLVSGLALSFKAIFTNRN